MPELGAQPIEPEYIEKMNAMARVLDEFLNGAALARGKRATGFVLLVFPYDSHDGRCNFISNGADRKDIVVLFKEMIARFEGQPEVRGNA